MKKYFAILSLILSIQSFAESRQVVVLTSILTPETQPFWRSSLFDIETVISKKFEGLFNNSGYELIIKHGATAEVLERYLTSEKTLALFWVSHSGASNSIFAQAILDINGNNIKDVFKNVHPNLAFLGFIGCESKDVVMEIRRQGHYKANKSLATHSFARKVSLTKAIKKSVIASAKVLDRNPNNFKTNLREIYPPKHLRTNIIAIPELTSMLKTKSNILKKGVRLQITNSEPEHSALLSVGNFFLGVLKKGNEAQEFIIPFAAKKFNQFKVKVSYENKILKLDRPIIELDIIYNTANYNLSPRYNSREEMYGEKDNYYYIKNN